MFSRLGNFVAQHWALVIVAWIVAVVGMWWLAPRWDDVTLDGDLAHLPAHMRSIQGRELLDRAFPKTRAKSQFVLVVARGDQRLERSDYQAAQSLAAAFRRKKEEGTLPLLDVWTWETPVVGRMLVSRDRHATMVVLQLRNEAASVENIDFLADVEEELRERRRNLPEGLEVGVTGSAAIGGDMLSSAKESISNTERFTVLLVLLILLVVYRAPLMVIVPLASIFVSVFVALRVVALLTQLDLVPGFEWWTFRVFKTTKIFIVVILYGAGTDYCLFLISRYKELLATGLEHREACAQALGRVGKALTASALTTIVGLGMMAFADFGKFANSGPAIAICLVVALAACMTLAPALLSALGRAVFWPFAAPADDEASAGAPLMGSFWEWASRAILARPGLILASCLLLMAPFAYLGLSVDITYDLLSELQRGRPSVYGTALLRRHFPPGETGPLTVLVEKDAPSFETRQGRYDIARLTKTLYGIRDEGGERVVTGVRSVTEPRGEPPGSVRLFRKNSLIELTANVHPLTRALYVTDVPELKGRVARFDLILTHDPFSAEALETLELVEEKLAEVRSDAESPWYNVPFKVAGTTAGIRDLKLVTDSDRVLIQRLVVIAVLAVLLLILRNPMVCFYLIVSVLWSYLVTIGITELFFTWLYGATFHGLDWKVPIFLFVILIAIGEDYNIYLTTRIFEEQERLGPREGLRVAVIRTGGIITSCGLIMVGTFISMMTGTLRGMVELGFALSLGVLLDTFVVRPVLVPAFFALIAPRESRPEEREETKELLPANPAR